MTCRSIQRSTPAVVAMVGLTLLHVSRAEAQSAGSGTPQPTSVAVSPYRAPTIAVAQPLDGGSVYQDRPTILIRFAANDAGDGLDLGSFAVAVDGVDRTHAFQLSALEAWGSITTATDAAPVIGEHRVSARICSMHGACGTAHATVIVLPPFAAAAPPTQNVSPKRSRTKEILGAALDAARRLFVP